MVGAQYSLVVDVRWMTDNKTIQVRLEAHPDHEYKVCALEDVSPTQQEAQIQVGDLAVLAGHYMIVAEQEEGTYDGYFCGNYLKITDVTVPTQSLRGAKRRAAATGQQQGGGNGAGRSSDQLGMEGMMSGSVILL
jgi:hypothetical protein